MLDSVIITHGRIVKEALAASERLAEQGHRTGILLLEQLKPYGEIAKQLLPYLPQKACKVVFLEEEIKAGGMGMMLSEALSRYERMQNKTVCILALDDDFCVQEANEPIYKSAGVDRESIIRTVLA